MLPRRIKFSPHNDTCGTTLSIQHTHYKLLPHPAFCDPDIVLQTVCLSLLYSDSCVVSPRIVIQKGCPCLSSLQWCRMIASVQSVTQSCLTVCDPMNCSTPGLCVHHQLLESTQTHVHWVNDAIQPSHPLSSPSPSALNFSQHQGLFKWVSTLHQVAKGLEFQLQH